MLDFLEYEFMQNTLLLLLIISPVFGLLSTMVVNNKLAYFSDALGHSAYMGIALGLIIGMTTSSIIPILVFSSIFSILLVLIKRSFRESPDTVIGIISSISLALGIIILSNYGGIQKFSSILVGDPLLVDKSELIYLLILGIAICLVFALIYKKMILINIDKSLARSKGINPTKYEIIFTLIIAVAVSISINIIGVLLINSLFILPAATSKNVSKNMKQYITFSVIISILSSIVGLLLSYYLAAYKLPTGASIVIICGIAYIASLIIKKLIK